MTNGATPLFQAALKGQVEVVRFLVESGAHKKVAKDGTDGATPFFCSS